MSGSSRKDSGAGSKTRYQSLNLVHSYKGASHDYNKGVPKRGSMQSLGKIATTARRMPAPAQLRSLKSSNDGQDPTVALVPQGGGGWSKDDERKKEEKEDTLNYTRKTEKPSDTTVPEGFKENFPSLKEQEKMSKREREELERRQREEICDDPGTSPPIPASSRSHQSRRPPKDAWGGPSYQHGIGQQYNIQQQQQQQQQHGVYSQRHDIHRQSYPSRAGINNNKYNQSYQTGPSHHQNIPHYRNTSQYPSQPHIVPYIDPYTIPPKDGGNVLITNNDRPIQDLSEEDRRQLEDDEGWAGHQEEVDYSKEVVFEDSSDEESPKKTNKEESVRRISKLKESVTDKHVSEGFPEEQKPQKRQNTPRYHQQQHGGHPPYPPYNYKQPPYQQGWQPYYQQPQQRGGPPPYRQDQREGPHPYRQDQGGRHPRSEHDDNRSNRHHVWESEGQFNKRDDNPVRGGSHGDVSQMLTVSHDINEEFQESIIDNRENAESPNIVQSSSPDIDVSNMRNYPKKIMIRDLGDKLSGIDGQSSGRQGHGNDDSIDGDNQKTKIAWGKAPTRTQHLPLETDGAIHPVPPVQSPNETVPHIPTDRGPVVTSKTLYEPEGRTSQEKFRKYQRSMSGGGGGANEHQQTHGKHRVPSNKSETGGKEECSDVGGVCKQEEENSVFVEEDKKKMIKRNDTEPMKDEMNDPPLKEGKNDRRDGRGRYREEDRKGIDKGDNRRRGPRHEQDFDRRQDSEKPRTNNQKRKFEDNYDDRQRQHNNNNRGGGTSDKGHETSDRSRGTSDRGRQTSDKGRGTSDRVHETSDRSRGTSDRGRETSDRGRQTSDKGRGTSDRGREKSDRGHETSDKGRQTSDRGRGTSDRGHETSDRSRETSDRGRGNSDRSHLDSDRGRLDSDRGRATSDGGRDTSDRGRGNSGRGRGNSDRSNLASDRGRLDSDGVRDTSDRSRGNSGRGRGNSGRGRGDSNKGRLDSDRGRGISDRGRGNSDRGGYTTRNDIDDRQDQKGTRRTQQTNRSGRENYEQDYHDTWIQSDTQTVNKEQRDNHKHEQINQLPNKESRGQKSTDTDTDNQRYRDNRRNTHDSTTSDRQPRRHEKGRYDDRKDSQFSRQDTIPQRKDSRQVDKTKQDVNQDSRNPQTQEVKQESSLSNQGSRQDSSKHEPRQGFRQSSRHGSVSSRQEYKNEPLSPKRVTDESNINSEDNTKKHDKMSNKEDRKNDEKTQSLNRKKKPQIEDDGDHYTRQTTKRPLSMREREDRGNGGYRRDRHNDDYDEINRGVPLRRNNRKEVEYQQDEFPTRTFERFSKSERGRDYHRGRRDTRGGNPSDRRRIAVEDGSKRNEVYTDLDDIDSPSDWEDDNGVYNDKVPVNKKRSQDDDVIEKSKQDKYSARFDQNRRGRGQDRGRRGKRNPRVREDMRLGQNQLSSQNRDNDDKFVDKTDTPLDEVPSKDYNFEKYDINAHNVYVMDRRSSYSDGEVQSPGVAAEEGFIEVKSKRDKQKDREERRRSDGPQQKKDDYSNRSKGSTGRSQDHGHTGGKVWGQTQQQKKTDSLLREPTNEEWPINEGRSAYGAVGDKPSRDKGTNHIDLQKTAGLDPNSVGYKLFETEKGQTGPFTFESSITTTPRKGDRLQAAIEITLPSSPQISTSFDSATTTPIINQQSLVGNNNNNNPSSKIQQSSTKTVTVSNKDIRIKNSTNNEDHGGRVGGNSRTDTDRNKSRRPKTEQKYYTPPGARHDDRPGMTSRDQRSRSSKHVSSTRSKVHHDDTDDEIQEEKQEKSKTDSIEGVYLRQHQDGGRGHIIMGRDSHEIEENVSGDSDQTRPYDTDIIPTVLKGQGLVPQTSSKFGTVSYASALKRQGQSVHQEVIEENSLTLLSPVIDTSLYSGESCTSVTNDGITPLHGVLLDSMLPDSDDEGDRGSTHAYSPSQRQHTVSNNALSPSQYTTQPFSPPIPLSSNIPKPYSNSSVFRGADSGMSGGVESPTTNDEIEHVQSGLTSHSVTKLLQEETRPSSAQSLTDSYSRFPKTYSHLTDGSISPVIIGGKTAGGPIIRVSSAPSHLPLNIMGHIKTREDSEGDDDNDDDTESVKTDDSVSTNCKSMLNIAANEFVPNHQLSRKKTPHKPSRDQQHTKGRGYQGQRGGGGGSKGNMSVHNQKGHISQGKIHHNHFHQQQQQQHPHHHHHHHHTPQQPHPHPPPQQQQPLINKPPIDILLQFLLNATHQQNLKNVPSNLLLRLPGSNMPIPLSTPQTHPSLPLSYPPQMTNAFPYHVPHPGILSQSLYHRKMLAQEGIPTPHGMPRLPIVNPTAQYTPGGGSKVHVPIAPEGSVEMNQVPNVLLAANRPSYYTAAPLHHNQTPPQLSAVMVPHHQVQLHHLPSTRPSHVPPLNIPQVPPPSLKLPRPVIGEQQSNSNSRPPLLPTPPGFNLVHQTSAVATPSVTTPPSLHHPNWSVHPQAIRLGLPPNIQ